jgi:hypothetical protein
MAYPTDYVPPAGLTSWTEIDAGDSIINTDKRFKAFHQSLLRLINSTRAYNQANPSVPVAQLEMSHDADANLLEVSGSLAYKREANGTGGFINTALNYLGNFSDWTIPTTGEFEGTKSLQDAVLYQADQLLRFLDYVTETEAIKNISELFEMTDNKSTGAYDFTFKMPTVSTIGADGTPQVIVQELGIIGDLQAGLI